MRPDMIWGVHRFSTVDKNGVSLFDLYVRSISEHQSSSENAVENDEANLISNNSTLIRFSPSIEDQFVRFSGSSQQTTPLNRQARALVQAMKLPKLWTFGTTTYFPPKCVSELMLSQRRVLGWLSY